MRDSRDSEYVVYPSTLIKPNILLVYTSFILIVHLISVQLKCTNNSESRSLLITSNCRRLYSYFILFSAKKNLKYENKM